MSERFYHQNVFAAFENGVELDLRARLAIEFIKSPAANLVADTQLEDVTPAGVAKFFLDLAGELLEQVEVRGWAHALPDHDGLSAPMKLNIARNVRAQVYQQTAGNRIAREEQGAVQVMPAGGMPPARGAN